MVLVFATCGERRELVGRVDAGEIHLVDSLRIHAEESGWKLLIKSCAEAVPSTRLKVATFSIEHRVPMEDRVRPVGIKEFESWKAGGGSRMREGWIYLRDVHPVRRKFIVDEAKDMRRFANETSVLDSLRQAAVCVEHNEMPYSDRMARIKFKDPDGRVAAYYREQGIPWECYRDDMS